MHSNEWGRVCPCPLIDRKRKHYENAVDVVVRLHDPTDPSTERTTPPSSAHVRDGRRLLLIDPARGKERLRKKAPPAARRRGDGYGEVIRVGLHLSTTKI